MSFPLISLFLALGWAAGIAHFAALAKDADLLVRGGPALVAIGLRLGRMLVTILVLCVAAYSGWQALLAAGAGFLAGRQWLLWRLGRVA